MLPPSAHTQRLGSLQSPCICRSRKGTPPAHRPPRVNYTHVKARVLLFAFAAFCKCTPPGTGEERTLKCMILHLRAAVRFLQTSASAHLRGQVKKGPGDACTYTRVLRFVSAAFCKCTPPGTAEERTPRCMHLYMRAAVGICSLLQVHTSGHR